MTVQILGLLASGVHRYDGRPSEEFEVDAGVDRIEVRAGCGVVGDRYAGKPAHRDAALTVLAAEAVEAVAAELGAGPFDPLLLRRTVVLRGAEVEALRGQAFTLDSGDGPVLLLGGRAAHPCAWLDRVLAPGAQAAFRGRAGVRCAATGGGVLRLGPAVLSAAVPLDPARAGVAVRGPRAGRPQPSDVPLFRSITRS